MDTKFLNLTGSELVDDLAVSNNESSENITLLVSAPEVGFSLLMANGLDVKSALEKWQEMSTYAIDVYRANYSRYRVRLITDIEQLPANLQPLKQPSETINIFSCLLALGKPDVQKTYEWLKAAAVNFSEIKPKEYSIEDLVQQIKIKLEEAPKTTKNTTQNVTQELNDLKEENELLLLQLQQVQEELEQTFVAKRDVEQQVETLEREVAAAQAEQAQSSTGTSVNEQELNDLKEENELLLLQLQQVQEELEHYFIRCKELEAGGAIAENSSSSQPSYVQPALVTARQEDVTDSPAWRFIAPIYTKLDKLIRHLIYKRQAKVVNKSKLFDKKWYQQTYQDVKGFKGGAALHYVAHGAAEGRDPGPEFSSERYWAMNPDVAEKGTNPLVHYELFGKQEGRFY